MKMQRSSWLIYQRCLNFFGSVVGWAAAYYFIFCRLLSTSRFEFKLEDTIPILIALLGIAGFLPYTLSKISALK
jgi:hypothetical protein